MDACEATPMTTPMTTPPTTNGVVVGGGGGGTLKVRCRWQEGADIGPVTLDGDAGTVKDLKRALYEAEWLTRGGGGGEEGTTTDGDDGAGGETSTTAATTTVKPPGPNHLGIIMNGKVMGPDSKALSAFGLVPDGVERVVHMMVSERAIEWNGARRLPTDVKKDASSSNPTCCSIQ